MSILLLRHRWCGQLLAATCRRVCVRVCVCVCVRARACVCVCVCQDLAQCEALVRSVTDRYLPAGPGSVRGVGEGGLQQGGLSLTLGGVGALVVGAL